MPELMGNYSKCLSWWEIILSVYLAQGPEELYPKHEEAGSTLQGQVRAPLRPGPAGNTNSGPGIISLVRRVTSKCTDWFPMEYAS